MDGIKNNIGSLFNRVRRRGYKTKNKWDKTRTKQSKKRSFSDEVAEKGLPVNWRYVIILGAIAAIFMVGYYFVPLAYQSFVFEPTGVDEPELKIADQSRWDGKSRITVLLIGLDQQDEQHAFVDALVLVNLDPSEKKAGVFSINPDLRVFFPSLNKSGNLRTIYNDDKSRGRQISVIKEGVENLLAIRVDRYAFVNKQDMFNLSKNFDSLKLDVPSKIYDPDTITLPGSKYLSWTKGERVIDQSEFLAFMAADQNGKDDQLQRQMNLFVNWLQNFHGLKAVSDAKEILQLSAKTVKTNLSKQEIISLVLNLWDIRDNKINRGFTRKSSYTKDTTTSFYGSYSPIQDNIDQDISSIFFNINLLREQAQIEVLNGSGIKGLATNRSRWITNAGGRVIRTDNFNEHAEQTQIYVKDPEKYKLTMAELVKIFNNKAVINKKDFPQRHLGDIVIVLGTEYQ